MKRYVVFAALYLGTGAVSGVAGALFYKAFGNQNPNTPALTQCLDKQNACWQELSACKVKAEVSELKNPNKKGL